MNTASPVVRLNVEDRCIAEMTQGAVVLLINEQKWSDPINTRLTKEAIMSSHTARQCFEENLANFAHPENDPEKYNLYNGLANLANAIGNLENELASLKHDIHNLRRDRM